MNKRKQRGFDVIGQRFGRLEVIGEAEKRELPSGQKPRRVICKCDCGKTTDVLLLHLTRNRILSCGCITKVKNGESKHPVCRCYKSMLERCSPKYSEKHRYFERGISVCDEWANDYFKFKQWAMANGFKKGLQIDRIDNTKGYFPDNCRFVTNVINVNNRENTFYIEYKGQKIAFMLLMRNLNIRSLNKIQSIRARIKRGKSADLAIDTPIRVGNYKGFAKKEI